MSGMILLAIIIFKKKIFKFILQTFIPYPTKRLQHIKKNTRIVLFPNLQVFKQLTSVKNVCTNE